MQMTIYSVVLLDDEELILQSLQSLIDRNELRCRIVGTAKSGTKGKDLIDRIHPDIVITDIKMPEMTGLEIAAYCAKEKPNIKVIILSAYADFSFAQSAIRFGTVSYLLKPVNKKELTDTIENTVAELNKEQRTKEYQEREWADLQNAKTLAASSLLFSIARYGTTGLSTGINDWVKEKITTDGVVVMAGFFNTKEEIHTALSNGQTYLEEKLKEAGYAPVFGGADEKIILVCSFMSGIAQDVAKKRLVEVLKHIALEAPKELGICILCVSSVYNNEEKLQACYQEGLKILEKGFFFKKSCVIETFKKEESDLYDMNTPELVSAIKHGQAEKIEDLLKKWRNMLIHTEDKQLALAKIREYSREAALCAAKIGMPLDDLWVHQYQNENFDARFTCMYNGIMQVCGYTNKKTKVVGRVCLIVEERYHDHGLSLESIANQLELNSSYLSRLFKKEMNENFSDYMIRIRIEHAKELLRTTGLKTYIIAENVGFEDAHYFSQVFKKKCGLTPADYRTAMQKRRNFTT